MRYIGFSVVGLLCFLGGTAPVRSESRSKVPPGIVFDCDAPDGRSSRVELHPDGPPYIIRGAITAKLMAAAGKKWAPVGRARLQSWDGNDFVDIALFGSRTPQDATDGKLATQFSWRIDGGKTKTEVFGRAVMNEPIPFTIVADGEGKASLVFGQVKKVLPFKISEPPVAMALCSTGQFLFTDLSIVPNGEISPLTTPP